MLYYQELEMLPNFTTYQIKEEKGFTEICVHIANFACADIQFYSI